MPLALKIFDLPEGHGHSASSIHRRSRLGRDALGITELAETLGTTSRALRYYEELGLIAPQRSGRGGRTYCLTVRREAELIVMLRRAGRSIREIQSVLSGNGANDEATRSKVVAALRERLEELETQSDQLKALLTRFSSPGGSES